MICISNPKKIPLISLYVCYPPDQDNSIPRTLPRMACNVWPIQKQSLSAKHTVFTASRTVVYPSVYYITNPIYFYCPLMIHFEASLASSSSSSSLLFPFPLSGTPKPLYVAGLASILSSHLSTFGNGVISTPAQE